MAGSSDSKIKGQAPKVRNKGRAVGYWVGLSSARSNRPNRELVHRSPRQGINGYELNQVGSAAYRRLLARKGGHQSW